MYFFVVLQDFTGVFEIFGVTAIYTFFFLFFFMAVSILWLSISQEFSIRLLINFLAHDNTNTDRLSFFLECRQVILYYGGCCFTAVDVVLRRRILFSTVNSLNSYLQRGLGLLFELDGFLGSGSEV